VLADEFALNHDPLVAVPRRLDPILEIAVIVRQQSHDLERLGPNAMSLRPENN
jgi:hypothetical protein